VSKYFEIAERQSLIRVLLECEMKTSDMRITLESYDLGGTDEKVGSAFIARTGAVAALGAVTVVTAAAGRVKFGAREAEQLSHSFDIEKYSNVIAGTIRSAVGSTTGFHRDEFEDVHGSGPVLERLLPMVVELSNTHGTMEVVIPKEDPVIQEIIGICAEGAAQMERRLAAEGDRRANEEAARKVQAEDQVAAERVEAERAAEKHAAAARSAAEAEEHAMALRDGSLGAQWAAAIEARVQRAWIRSASAGAGLDCTVAVTQVPGGEVVGVRVQSCNGDETVRESIEAAVYRASPLPRPPDPSLFERNLEVRFKPDE